jgi:hypothetical protein
MEKAQQGGKWLFSWLTSPNSRNILKLRLLIFSRGVPGKQHMQFVNE